MLTIIEMIPEHTTPASSPWPQLCSPRVECRQCIRDVSLPIQPTSSSQMAPWPWPKKELDLAVLAVPQSMALHTTSASLMSHSSSHTVPHWPSCWTSTLPEHLSVPLTSLSGGLPEDRSTHVKSNDELKSNYEIVGFIWTVKCTQFCSY